jgi:prepilin-type N-terminal cleavage/methylation domain-containing protein
MASRKRFGTRIATSALNAMLHAPRTAGFSLIELMVVLVIIGVMSAAVMPSMSDVLADHRQAAAAIDVARIGRQARSLTMASGVAYALHFQQGSSDLGIVDLFRGATARCRETTWSQAAARPVSTVTLVTYNPSAGTPSADDSDRHVIVLEATRPDVTGTVADQWICYQPNGETYLGTGTEPAFTRQSDTNPVTLTVRGYVKKSGGSVQHGQNREILFAAGDTPRSR